MFIRNINLNILFIKKKGNRYLILFEIYFFYKEKMLNTKGYAAAFVAQKSNRSSSAYGRGGTKSKESYAKEFSVQNYAQKLQGQHQTYMAIKIL